MFPYEDYVSFFSKWFGNRYYLAIAFLLWIAIIIFGFYSLRRRSLWLRVPIVVALSVIHYLVFGLLFAPGYFGGEVQFLYDPLLLNENLTTYHGWQLILFWPAYLFPTGGFLIVLPVLAIGIVFWIVKIKPGKSKSKEINE